MNRLIENPDPSNRAGEAAQMDLQSRFAGSQILDKYIAFYRSLLSRHS